MSLGFHIIGAESDRPYQDELWKQLQALRKAAPRITAHTGGLPGGDVRQQQPGAAPGRVFGSV